MSLRSPLAQVRHLGSAKEGTHHWWQQRLSALALVPLSLWFVASLALMAGADHAAMVAWVGNPLVAVLLLALIFATFHHVYIGMQVVIEDYVHNGVWKLVLLLSVGAGCILLGLLAALSVLRLAI
jgi:succinate dehydrogenase / fumarate reductase membrane anchor subunit